MRRFIRLFFITPLRRPRIRHPAGRMFCFARLLPASPNYFRVWLRRTITRWAWQGKEQRALERGVALFLGLCLFLGLSNVLAEDAKIEAELNKGKCYIGDVCEYDVRLISKKQLEVKFPDISSGLSECEVSSPKISKPNIFARLFLFFTDKIYIASYRIVPFSVGPRKAGPFDVRCRVRGKGEWVVFKTPELSFNVASILDANPKDIKAIKPPLAPARSFRGGILIAVMMAISAGFVFLLYLKFSRKKTGFSSSKPAGASLTPQDAAFRRLSEIQSARILKKGDIKECYVEVSDCLRRFLEKTLNIKAPDMTTEEFLEDLKFSPKLSNEQKKLLEDFMLHCDMVKFAKYTPSQQEVDSTFKSAFRLIEQIRVLSK